ncbi:MAG: bifunctional metallophosphatase/5'-nucleotidase [Saccharopolyspora sp.]|uniref:bifunctional metallophosphatase/5'-nucleotidase n=1 Tax=Saccharopolyspora sp. TaxID=33915 RepID=UPI0025FC7AA1|nr:bifunctional UDP-sugar hydrolase/5'-nucleotidase [Saccharopolyspora sp.]MBQ6644202.1 bifunctional metallophosphatase/5'-nucleotidase [Saccharopolyspora sp.]
MRACRVRSAAVAVAACLVTFGTALPAQAAPADTEVRLITFNDLHGNLAAPSGSSGEVELADGTSVPAGGAAYLVAHIDRLRAEVPNSLVLSAGDSVGASPVESALFHDEPTVEFLNSQDVRAQVVGNHEFDEGYPELQRMQRGGCHPEDGCAFRDSFDGSDFPTLGANVSFADGRPALLPFTVQRSGGVPIGIIGVTLHDLPQSVSPDAVAGLEFGDEVAAIDRTAEALDRLGVKAQVVLMHQGDEAAGGGPDSCAVAPEGPATRVAAAASPKVDALFTAHSHQQYNCTVDDPAGDPRPVVQGASYGRLLSTMDLSINHRTGDVVRDKTKARNEIVSRDIAPDPETAALVDEAKTKAAPIANREVGTATGDLSRDPAPSGETTLGDLIADAQLEATKGAGAQVALTNPGGIRADLPHRSSANGEGDGVITYGEAFAVQPFGNTMQTMTLTGAQLKNVLEQQWQGDGATMLQISSTLHYAYSESAPAGSKVSDLAIAGEPVDPGATYRVAVNNFLAGGGDGFSGFTEGTDVTGGPVDLDALLGYLGAHPGIVPPPADRITATG